MPVAGGATFQGSGGSIDNSNLVTSFKGKMKLVSSVTSEYNQTIRINTSILEIVSFLNISIFRTKNKEVEMVPFQILRKRLWLL